MESYDSLVIQLDISRKALSNLCGELKKTLDHSKNSWTTAQVKEHLMKIEHDFMKEQMKQILDSFSSMSETKLLQDKFEFRLLNMDQDNKRIVQEKRE